MDMDLSFRRPSLDRFFLQLLTAVAVMFLVVGDFVQHQRPPHVVSAAAQIEALGADFAEMIEAFGCDTPACAAHELDQYALQAEHRSATLLMP